MKKFILTISAIIATTLVAIAGKFDLIEDQIELKFSTISDANESYTIDEVDVDSFNGAPIIKLEIEGFWGDAGWSHFDKTKYNEYATKLANFVREQLNTKQKVKIMLVLDRTIGKKLLLEEGAF